MKFIANYHTHLKLCNHAIGMAEDYVKEAIKYNYEIIGISDHAPVLEHFMTKEEHSYNWTDENMSYDTFLNVYLKDVSNAKDKYKDKITVLTGIESEYIEEFKDYYLELKSHLDYMIVGIHYFKYNNKIYNTYAEITEDSLEGYCQTALNAIDSGLFKIVAHPDLFMYAYDNFTKKCEEITRRIIERAIEKNVYLEMNINGIRNALGKEWRYPNKNFWKIASEYKDLLVVINSDCHNPSYLYTELNEEMVKFSESLGIKICEKIEI